MELHKKTPALSLSITFKVLKGMRVRLGKFKLLFLQLLAKPTQSGTRKSTKVLPLNKYCCVVNEPKSQRLIPSRAAPRQPVVGIPAARSCLSRSLCLKRKQGANSHSYLLSAENNQHLKQQLKISSHCFRAEEREGRGILRIWAPTADPDTGKEAQQHQSSSFGKEQKDPPGQEEWNGLSKE